MASESGPSGRRLTLADVAARAGVSVPLVSIVMRDAPGASAATRERVRRIAEELGYRPDSRARLLRSARSRLIGVVARPVRHRAVDVIRTDDAAGLGQAVDHLVRLGHTRIAHIDGGRAPGAAERRRGYCEAMHRHGLAELADVVAGGAPP